MRNPSGHQGENERVSFLQVSRCGRAKQRQRNVQKKCAARAKLFFCLIELLLFFHVVVAFTA